MLTAHPTTSPALLHSPAAENLSRTTLPFLHKPNLSVSMQVALNILLFFAGFSIATFIALRPKKPGRDLETLRYVADGLHHKAQSLSTGCSAVEDERRVVQGDGENLLTK